MRCLFISDLHLCEQRPDITRALLHFLSDQAPHCDQLYLLGDIFEAWIGDDFIPQWLNPVITQLSRLSDQGVGLFFQHGNRDFLVGEQLMDKIGASLLPEIAVTTLPDEATALLLHGDQLCLEDIEYQKFRLMVRDRKWQQLFLSKPLEERLTIARQLRAASKEQGSMKSNDIMDVSAQAVSETLTDYDSRLMIHGHTHRPAIHDIDDAVPGARRIVLGDWDTSGWYLDCTEQGCQLISFPIAQ
ncbi:UDP-2,3-diacylglucosamine diphosphatase [Marinobacterium jannaschii]|uniref:UDP-2,3-diacylglucosamine diphosphatase n=1 Tax=Marinobacterium jannaschii TaxID=64970 RepID=UPI00047FF172|nr:UDP-2,3-diacylglucosamine diphosphatase [Marinobacterium jannaschii]